MMSTETDAAELRAFLERFRQLLLERFSHARQARNHDTDTELPALLSTYARLCEEANQRLRECFDLVHAGITLTRSSERSRNQICSLVVRCSRFRNVISSTMWRDFLVPKPLP